MFRYDVVKAKQLNYLRVFGSSIASLRPSIDSFRTWAASGETIGDFVRMKVTYTKQCGRMYASGKTLQHMPREVRNFLLPDNAVDIDMVNSAARIISALCARHGIEIYHLNDFVVNYDARMRELEETGSRDPKTEKMYIMFGGSTTGRQEWPDWVVMLKQELALVANNLRPHEEELWREAEIADRKEEEELRRKRARTGSRIHVRNVQGKFLSYVYFKYEWETLAMLDKIGTERGYWSEEITFMHDGILVNPLRDFNLQELEMELRQRSFDQVRLQLKPTDKTSITMEKDSHELIVNAMGMHDEAANMIVHKLNGNAIRSGITKYMKIRGVWMDDPKLVEEGMVRYVMQSNIKLSRVNSSGVETITGFSSDRRHAKLIATSVLERVEEIPTFGQQLVLGSTHKLAFLDGYWQFGNLPIDGVYGEFIRGGEFPTGAMINMQFPPRIEEDMQFVMNHILLPPFQGLEESLEILLKAMARALAGCVDKRTYIIVGPRNCGKSVIFQFVAATIGSYCAVLPSSILLSRSGSDTFRDNNWIFALEMARICRISEGKLWMRRKLFCLVMS